MQNGRRMTTTRLSTGAILSANDDRVRVDLHLSPRYHRYRYRSLSSAITTSPPPSPHHCQEIDRLVPPRCKWLNLPWQFSERHPRDLVVCPSEGSAPLPKCTRCVMQTASTGGLLRNQRKRLRCASSNTNNKCNMRLLGLHTSLLKCNSLRTWRGEELERVDTFKYHSGLVIVL